MDAEKWADLQDIAGRLEDMLKTAPENYYYLKGFIHCLSVKQEHWEAGGVSLSRQTSASSSRDF